jgi:GT2 family glycosyltransferase/peptidoglycan/xylan/chitin deacetylase (PgdA/CDA1 family)
MSATDEHPSFTIVVPTFERRDTVCDALRAIGAIDYPGAVEVIVVVDGSRDGTAAALAAIESPFPLTIIEQPNEGPASARNRGAAVATGDILLFLDDDMMCKPDILRQHATTLAEGADVVLGNFPVDPASPPGFLADTTGGWTEARAARFEANPAITAYDLMTGQVSIRRSVFEAVGGFDTAFTAGDNFGDEDVDLGARLVSRYAIRFNPLALSYHRYVVTAAENMQKALHAGRSDVAFARKHPIEGRFQFQLRRIDHPRTRFLVRPLAALPLLPEVLARISTWLAERAPRERNLTRHLIGRLFCFWRDVAYWQGVRQSGGLPRARRVLVLCFHSISDLSNDPVLADYAVPPAVFREQLASLAARGFTPIGPDEFIAGTQGMLKLPRRPVLFTFDDCYEDLPAVIESELRPRGIAPVVFAVTGLATNEWDQKAGARRLHLLDPQGLAQLARAGVEVGCHSRSHRVLTGLDPAALASETAGARGDFEAISLPAPRFFAYPYGLADSAGAASVRTAGFAAAFTIRPGRASRKSDPFALPRVQILARDKGWRFVAKTAFPIMTRMLG